MPLRRTGSTILPFRRSKHSPMVSVVVLLPSSKPRLTLIGVVRQMLVINGQFPGPLIRVNRGDRLLINVTNELSQPTTLHWHGLYQNGTNWMDGVSGITQCPIPPGRNFLYNYTVENQFGTFWYHSHTSTQYMDGLVGPFIVHAPEEATYQQMYDTDQVVLIQDWYHNISAELLPGYLAPGNENTEPVPDNGLIQGTALWVPPDLLPAWSASHEPVC